MQRKYSILPVILFLAGISSHTAAQEFITGPSTGTMDVKSLLGNPALISFQKPHVSLGVRVLHPGFFDDRESGYNQGYFSASLPRIRGSRYGAGFNVQYVNSPIFSKSQLSGAFSARFAHIFSFGLSASLYHTGYNRDNFSDDFDFGDPLFQNGYSRYAFNSVVGIYARPFSRLEFAAGARNVNQPDISIAGNGVREPIELFGAASFRHNALKGTVELVDGRYSMETRLHVELFSEQGYYARLGTNTDLNRGYIEAQMHLYAGVSVNYNFELPLGHLRSHTNGSHMFSLLYEFNRVPPLPVRRRAQFVLPEVQRTRNPVKTPSTVVLASQTNSLEYSVIHLSHMIDTSSVSREDLQHLTSEDIGWLQQDAESLVMAYGNARPIQQPLPDASEAIVFISDEYHQTLNFLRDFLFRKKDGLQFVINSGGELRASGLRSLTGNERDDEVPVLIRGNMEQEPGVTDNADEHENIVTLFSETSLKEQSVIILDPETIRIRLITTSPANAVAWRFRAYSGNGNLVTEFGAKENLPEYIDWDWRDGDGRILEPGVYTYHVIWDDGSGIWQETGNQFFSVKRTTRNITIEITRDLNRIHSDPDGIDLILKK